MEKMIAYEKLSKKKKRELNAAKRNTWGALRPVTRKPAYSGAYDRCKTRKRFDDDSFPCFFGSICTVAGPVFSIALV